MEANHGKSNADGGAGLPLYAEKERLARLYFSTCEILARYAYEATARQQQLNIVAQQVTVANARRLYTGG